MNKPLEGLKRRSHHVSCMYVCSLAGSKEAKDHFEVTVDVVKPFGHMLIQTKTNWR
jgi:hypothetical protein